MERVNIEGALEEIEALYSDWGIPAENWRFLCGWAFRLQGYEVTKDLECIDTEVLRSALPWQSKERLTIPPRDSKYMEGYVALMRRTGFDIHIHPTMSMVGGGLLPEGTPYRLPNGRLIYLLPVLLTIRILGEIAEFFANFGGMEAWIREHIEILQEIRDLALKKEESQITEECDQIIQKYVSHAK